MSVSDEEGDGGFMIVDGVDGKLETTVGMFEVMFYGFPIPWKRQTPWGFDDSCLNWENKIHPQALRMSGEAWHLFVVGVTLRGVFQHVLPLKEKDAHEATKQGREGRLFRRMRKRPSLRFGIGARLTLGIPPRGATVERAGFSKKFGKGRLACLRTCIYFLYCRSSWGP